jgi:hypothetical protein
VPPPLTIFPNPTRLKEWRKKQHQQLITDKLKLLLFFLLLLHFQQPQWFCPPENVSEAFDHIRSD